MDISRDEGWIMPRQRRFRAELMNNGTHTGANGVELGRIDLVDGIYVVNEPAIYKWLMSNSYNAGVTPITKINQVFGPSFSYKPDPIVMTTLYSMHSMGLIELIGDKNNAPTYVRPLVTIAVALKKLPVYTTRAEQLAGLEPLED